MDPERLAALIARVREEGAVRAREGLSKLGRVAEGQLIEALAKEGLEHTGQSIRVRLPEQIAAVVARAGDEGISERDLSAGVKGARGATEVRLALEEMQQRGEVVRLCDGPIVRIAAPGAAHLSRDEATKLGDVVDALVVLTSPLRRSTSSALRPTLARRALAPLAARLNELARGNTSAQFEPAPPASDEPASDEPANERDEHDERARAALAAALAVSPDELGLVRLPPVIAALERLHPRERLLQAARALAGERALELRPHAGLEPLSEQDRARCPSALDGTPLVYARLLDRQGAPP